MLAALALVRDPREVRLRTLAHSAQAEDLRLARLLAWMRDQPLEQLGYAGWQDFCRERVDWQEAWVRGMVRLVRSDLRDVIAAACRGEIPLGLAVQAPGWCPPDAQAGWLQQAREGKLPPRPRGRPRGASFTVEPSEEDARAIWHARRKACLLTGLQLTDRDADDRMLAWWRAGRGDLVDEALAPAPRPAPSPDLDWEFEDLLGRWQPPTSLAEGLQELDALQAKRKGRIAELGALYEEVVRRQLHKGWGYGTIEAFCQIALGLSARSLQRYRELGRALRRHPELGELPHTKAALVARVASPWNVGRWIAVANRVGVTELMAAVAHTEAGADLLEAYETAMVATTTTVGLAAVKEPVPATLTDRVHPDLPKAARWLLYEVELPRPQGFARVKEREDYTCANPESRRRALRNHAHHRIYRIHGGGDDDDNAECVCPSCHLRLIHPGHVRVEAVGATRVWTYPDRVVTVFLGKVA